jgi:hypothetical protein
MELFSLKNGIRKPIGGTISIDNCTIIEIAAMIERPAIGRSERFLRSFSCGDIEVRGRKRI